MATSIEGLIPVWAVASGPASWTTKTIRTPIVTLVRSAPTRYPSNSGFGSGRKSITVTAARRLALAAATRDRRKMWNIGRGRSGAQGRAVAGDLAVGRHQPLLRQLLDQQREHLLAERP